MVSSDWRNFGESQAVASALVSFYRFPKPHWQHIRTSNAVESPLLRLRMDAAKRFKKVENATAVIFKLLLVVEKHFRRLNGP